MEKNKIKNQTITLRNIKTAADLFIETEYRKSYNFNLEKNKRNNNRNYKLKLTLTTLCSKRGLKINYEFFADTKKQLVLNIFDLEHQDDLTNYFEKFYLI